MTHPNVGTPVAGAYARPRCYHEYCNAAPTLHLHDYGHGASGPYDPARPVYEYRGVWGYCEFHLPRIMGGQHQ